MAEIGRGEVSPPALSALPPRLADIPIADRWLTRSEAAAYCQVNVATISRACSSGRLAHVKIGGGKAVRFRLAWLDEWLEDGFRPRVERSS
jgi:excisionase family DNA binding protein